MSETAIYIQQYLDGNDEALGAIYTASCNRLLMFAYYHCRDRELSRDIVQDVFEKMASIPITQRKEYFQPEERNLEGWLHLAIKNKCIDHYRVFSNREKILSNVRFLFNGSVDNTSLERFTQEGFRQLLSQLQPREQEIIRLHLDGYSNEEIAAQLNITYNTVKNNIYESKQKLRRLWQYWMK